MIKKLSVVLISAAVGMGTLIGCGGGGKDNDDRKAEFATQCVKDGGVVGDEGEDDDSFCTFPDGRDQRDLDIDDDEKKHKSKKKHKSSSKSKSHSKSKR